MRDFDGKTPAEVTAELASDLGITQEDNAADYRMLHKMVVQDMWEHRTGERQTA